MQNERVCDICSTRRASMSITALRVDSFDGRTFVCTRCGLESRCFKANQGFDLAGFVLAASNKHVGNVTLMGCPECGTSLADVVTGGRMGCVVCYDRFASEVETALISIHGDVVHRGKMP